MDGADPATGPCRLVGQEDEQGAPPRVTKRLGQLALLPPVGRLCCRVIDRLVLAHQVERRLVLVVYALVVYALASHRLLRPGEYCSSAIPYTFVLPDRRKTGNQ
jgi:hypothetical protein